MIGTCTEIGMKDHTMRAEGRGIKSRRKWMMRISAIGLGVFLGCGIVSITVGFAYVILDPTQWKSSNLLFHALDNFSMPYFVASLRESPSIHVYEGLPHQTRERRLFETELKLKPCSAVGDYYFYESKLDISVDDMKTLRSLAAADETYREWGGPKACGDFHPDYAIEWSEDDDAHYALLCFGCEEVKFYGPYLKAHFDIHWESWGKFEKILRRYQLNRP